MAWCAQHVTTRPINRYAYTCKRMGEEEKQMVAPTRGNAPHLLDLRSLLDRAGSTLFLKNAL